MSSKLDIFIKDAFTDFFNLINKKYNINVKSDWEDFQNVHFCVYKYINKPRKGEVCAVKIKNGDFCTKHKPKKEVKTVVINKIVEPKKLQKVEQKVDDDIEPKKLQKVDDDIDPNLKSQKVDDDIDPNLKSQKVDDDIEPNLKSPKVESNIDKNLVVMLNHKIGKYVHRSTRLIFFSKEHKVVYAKLSIDDKIIPLSDKDIDICKKYQFRNDTTLFK